MLESSKVPALTRAIDILNLIARIGPCSAATIIDTLGIPKSTAYLLLNELRRQRFLSLDHQENFCLWTRLVELSGHALSKMDLRELARPRLTQLMDTTGPPYGERGVGASVARAARWGRIENYMAQVNDSLCLLVQVESKTALDNLDEILDVEGIDGVFIGPADLSASLGYPDNAGHPEVQRIIETSIRRIRAAGKAAGFLAVAPDMAQQCLAWGANFVAVGVDTMLYSDALDQRLAMFKSGKNGPRIKGSY